MIHAEGLHNGLTPEMTPLHLKHHHRVSPEQSKFPPLAAHLHMQKYGLQSTGSVEGDRIVAYHHSAHLQETETDGEEGRRRSDREDQQDRK